MKIRELSDDIIEATESTPPEAVELLKKFKVGECWQKSIDVGDKPNDTSTMLMYVERLRNAGLDIGKGDAEFGYRMPIPERENGHRYLQIFRRKVSEVLEPDQNEIESSDGQKQNARPRKTQRPGKGR